MTDLENPEMRCAKYYQLSVLQPKHCYNCVMRSGYPWYIFGDNGCDNFQEIFSEADIR